MMTKRKYLASVISIEERDPLPETGWNTYSGETEREAVAKALTRKRALGASKGRYQVVVARVYGVVEEPLSYTILPMTEE